VNGISAPSNRLSIAEDRLKRAMDRLEAALENRSADGDGVADGQVAAQLQALQDENAELRDLVDTTAQRLDGTIAKFKEQLAG